MDHLDFMLTIEQGGPGVAAPAPARIRLIDSFPQNSGHKMGNRDHRIALTWQNPAAEPRTRAFGQMPAQNDFWLGSGEPGREHRRPKIPAMMSMDNLDSLPPD